MKYFTACVVLILFFAAGAGQARELEVNTATLAMGDQMRIDFLQPFTDIPVVVATNDTVDTRPTQIRITDIDAGGFTATRVFPSRLSGEVSPGAAVFS